MTIGIICSSGVGQRDRDTFKTDGIGDLADVLAQLPGVSVKVTRMIETRFRREQAIAECVGWLLYESQFDHIGMVAHSAGADFDCDVARGIQAEGRSVDWMLLSDGWAKDRRLFIPANVIRGESWTQEHPKAKIHGVPIVLQSDSTEWIRHDALTDVKHAAMARLKEFHDRAVQLAMGGT